MELMKSVACLTQRINSKILYCVFIGIHATFLIVTVMNCNIYIYLIQYFSAV